MTEATAINYIGQPLRRREDFKFVTGKGRYIDDIKAPGMLHMAVLRSPHAHAIIKKRRSLRGERRAGRPPGFVGQGSRRQDRPDRSELDHPGNEGAGPARGRDRSGSLRRRMRRAGGRGNARPKPTTPSG